MTARPAPPASDATGREARNGRPELPLIGAKRPEIRLPHENSKSILAGSNPSNRRLADCGIVVPSDQGTSKSSSIPGFARAVDRKLAGPGRRNSAPG